MLNISITEALCNCFACYMTYWAPLISPHIGYIFKAPFISSFLTLGIQKLIPLWVIVQESWIHMKSTEYSISLSLCHHVHTLFTNGKKNNYLYKNILFLFRFFGKWMFIWINVVPSCYTGTRWKLNITSYSSCSWVILLTVYAMLIRWFDVMDPSVVFISMAELYSQSNCTSLIINVYSHFLLVICKSYSSRKTVPVLQRSDNLTAMTEDGKMK